MCHLRAESGRFLGFRLRLTNVEGFSNVGQSLCWSTAQTGRERCLNMKVKCNAEQLNQKKWKSKLILYTTFQFFNYITVFSILKESLQIYNFKILYRTGNVVRGTRAGSTWRRRGWSELGGTRWRRRTEGKQIVTTLKVDLSLDMAGFYIVKCRRRRTEGRQIVTTLKADLSLDMAGFYIMKHNRKTFSQL